MTPYFILLTVICVLGRIRKKFPRVHGLYIFFNGLIFLILCLFSGLRARSVGTDTNAYIEAYKYSNEQSISAVLNSESSVEIGFRFLRYFSSLLTDEAYIFLVLISAFIIFFSIKSVELVV